MTIGATRLRSRIAQIRPEGERHKHPEDKTPVEL